MKWTDKEITILKNGYSEFGSNLPIDRTKKQINKKARILGIKVSKDARSKIMSKISSLPKPGACNVTSISFKNPDCYSSYILGLLWGDGNLSKTSYNIAIECLKTDLEQVEPIFNKTGKWTKTIRHRKNRKKQMTFKTSNMDLHTYLTKYNYLNKANLNSTIIEQIPQNILHYWWRGYFDADGCIYTNKKHYMVQVSLASSYEQDWTFAENLFKKLGCKYTIARREQLQHGKLNHSSIIRITNKPDCLKFLNYIYDGEIFGFSRKYEHYSSLNCL